MSERLAEVTLASASPRRLRLLESLGLRVVVVRSAYEERDDLASDGLADLALRHALGKAAGADPSGPPVLVAADTVVDVDGASLVKPRDDADAKRMLRVLSGRWHIVHTGFTVVDRAAGASVCGVESARVKFVDLDDATIDRYVATGEPSDKAGAYGIQGKGALLVERIDGDFYTVMGLPLARVNAAARGLGREIA
jgi:nucleoside triphosphate pyrophosphatase